MLCPYCKDTKNKSKVIDSRDAGEGFVIRRRRECLNEGCHRRFTTYEKIDEPSLAVIKKSGGRHPFDISKIANSVEIACCKLGIDGETLDETLKRVEAEIRDTHEREVTTRFIGQLVMRELRSLHQVAYVRYASVYKDFKDISEYIKIMQPLLEAPSDEA
jgi:transcriptional repressor NrdR